MESDTLLLFTGEASRILHLFELRSPGAIHPCTSGLKSFASLFSVVLKSPFSSGQYPQLQVLDTVHLKMDSSTSQ